MKSTILFIFAISGITACSNDSQFQTAKRSTATPTPEPTIVSTPFEIKGSDSKAIEPVMREETPLPVITKIPGLSQEKPTYANSGGPNETTYVENPTVTAKPGDDAIDIDPLNCSEGILGGGFLINGVCDAFPVRLHKWKSKSNSNVVYTECSSSQNEAYCSTYNPAASQYEYVGPADFRVFKDARVKSLFSNIVREYTICHKPLSNSSRPTYDVYDDSNCTGGKKESFYVFTAVPENYKTGLTDVSDFGTQDGPRLPKRVSALNGSNKMFITRP